jgi:hypothetical protein
MIGDVANYCQIILLLPLMLNLPKMKIMMCSSSPVAGLATPQPMVEHIQLVATPPIAPPAAAQNTQRVYYL